MMFRRLWTFFAPPLVVGCVAAQIIAASAARDVFAAESPQAIGTELRTKLSDPTIQQFDVADIDDVRAFYASREDRPVWLDEMGLTRAGRLLVAEIGSASEWGLNAADFEFKAVQQPKSNGRWSVAQTVEAELEITRLALKYAAHARGARISEPSTQLSTYLDRRPSLPKASDVLGMLVQSGAPHEVLQGFQPAHDQFRKLKAYLAQIRAETARQLETRLDPRGAELRKGDRNGDVIVLRRRLAVPGVAGGEDVYDDALRAAVISFQSSKSLRADGVVGKATRKALNGGDIADRTEAVIANMEQWRWMPADLGATHAFVNVPSYSIDFVSNGVPIFSDRVVVGTEETQTPIFSHNLEMIVVRPEWNLPDSIKIKKVVAAGGNGRTLESHGYHIRGKNGRIINSSRVNWSRADLSQYTIFQPSGNGNALGLVKFLFPNKHSVYLHDTPDKSLFNEKARLFSHGCVRVRNPLAFAQAVFDFDQGADTLNAARLAKSGAFNNQISLNRAIPVHIGYFTVWMQPDGTPAFLADSYGHQKRIALALNNQWSKIDKGKDHLAAIDMSDVKDMLAKQRQASRRAKNRTAGVLSPPSGVTNSFRPYRSTGSVVSDLIRRAFAN